MKTLKEVAVGQTVTVKKLSGARSEEHTSELQSLKRSRMPSSA